MRPLLLLALLISLFAGCASAPRGTALPADEFNFLKNQPATRDNYYRYLGVVDGYETLEYYESPSNSGLPPIKANEYHLDPEFYLKSTITLRYSDTKTWLAILEPDTPRPTSPIIVNTTVESVQQKSPHPSKPGEIDKAVFKLQPGQSVPKYPNCKTIILLYDQHAFPLSRPFTPGDPCPFEFTPTGQFINLKPHYRKDFRL